MLFNNGSLLLDDIWLPDTRSLGCVAEVDRRVIFQVPLLLGPNTRSADVFQASSDRG